MKFATDTETQRNYAIKVFARDSLTVEMQRQIKEEVAILQHVRHPNVVHLREVLASRRHVYVVLELVTGGELFDRIVEEGRMSEPIARVYFQQLVDGVSYCHERGVCHRDLKPEARDRSERTRRCRCFALAGRCVPSDPAPSPLEPAARRWRPPEDLRLRAVVPARAQRAVYGGAAHDLRHAQLRCPGGACGAGKAHRGAAHLATRQVLRGAGYDGRAADVWSLGCILYVLTAGGMPFDEPGLPQLFAAIAQARFRMPPHFSPALASLVGAILTADPKQRATMADIVAHPWFAQGYARAAVPDDVSGAGEPGFDDGGVEFVEVSVAAQPAGGADGATPDARPQPMTAFDLIGAASGLDLGRMFERTGAGEPQRHVAGPTRFPSVAPAEDIVAALRSAAQQAGLQATGAGFKLRLAGSPRRGATPLVAAAQVFELCSGLHMVDIRKLRGDTRDYADLYRDLLARCAHLVLQPQRPGAQGDAQPQPGGVAPQGGAAAASLATAPVAIPLSRGGGAAPPASGLERALSI